VVTLQKNNQNRRKIIKKTSIYNGVYYRKDRSKWVARIYDLNGRAISLGHYLTEVEAALAYNKKAEELGYLTRNIINDSD
jgi:hypothetical protein